MNKRIFILAAHDLVKYPPMQSLLSVLSELKVETHFIGLNSDQDAQTRFEKRGVKFISYNGIRTNSMIKTFFIRKKYKKQVEAYLSANNVTKEDLIIYEYGDSAYYMHSVLANYRYVVLFYEFVNTNLSWKLDIQFPSYNMKRFLQGAAAVTHCEYNRAQICQWYYGLNKTPYILPNKPYGNELENQESEIPIEIDKLIKKLKNQLSGKKIILYQGIFNSSERRLEEFCQAISLLPDEYVLIAMGGGQGYYEELKTRYESDRILFLPFIKPPFHLLVTKMAHIGVLSYFPLNSTWAGVLNPIYCAPNKVFEYGKYGIPMLSNDIPGLSYIYNLYKCGRAVTSPITPEKIVVAIKSIESNYNTLSEGSLNYYNSIDFKRLACQMLNDLEII